jgi:hypothetical protein
MPPAVVDLTDRRIKRRPVLGGLINEVNDPILFPSGTGSTSVIATLTGADVIWS